MFIFSKPTVVLSLVFSLSAPLFVTVASAAESSTNATAEAPTTALTSGEIKKVDLDTGKMTIQHGPLVNLHMPAMTMVFKAKDPALLQSLKAGDKVRFAAESVGGSLVVTTLEKQP